jgi:hypothetical protein
MGRAIFEGNGQTFSFHTTTYNVDLKDELKVVVPYACRTWNPGESYGRRRTRGHWEISSHYLDKLKHLCKQYGFGVETTGQFDQPQEKTVTITLDYMGLVRHRGGDIYTSSGWVNDGWNATFTMEVLQKWFGFTVAAPGKKQTLYAVLSISSGSTGSEVKKAYRRAARTWHPDVCKEPDAEDQFKKVQAAYEKLRDPRFRLAYDAGLKYEDDVENDVSSVDVEAVNWKPPVRCGVLKIKAIAVPSKFEEKYQVKEILAWDDIVDAKGRTMVTYWPPKGDTFETKWVW